MKRNQNKLYLYGDDIGSVELIEAVGTDKTIVNAARISFGVEKKKLDEKFKDDEEEEVAPGVGLPKPKVFYFYNSK